MAALLLAGNDVRADVYKCTAEDGSLTYQQTPCPKQKVEKLNVERTDAAAPGCVYANKFAVSTARLMRAGQSSDEVFNRYGGLDALSKGSIGVINYVYSFRTNDDVSVERIAALTQAKCRARSLGDVSCELMPLSFTESLGGCDGEGEVAINEPVAQAPALAPALNRKTENTVSTEFVEQCKKRYRDQIDAIDAQMRQGYTSAQGEAYRERLRALTEQLRNC